MNEREEYEKKWNAKIDEWQAKIDFLEAKAEQAEADTRIEIQEQIEELRQREDEARQRLRNLKQAGSEAWEEMDKSMEAAVDNLKEGIERALSRFK